MSVDENWQLDGSTPELYERYLVPAITSIWASDLLDRAALEPGDSVLDVACGTGIVARLAAQRTGGRVVGLDLNAGMLAVARSVTNPGVPIEWVEGSALGLPFADNTFDLVLCQLGLQFFPDRHLALREMRRVLVPSGRVALSVFSAIEHTPAAHAYVLALDRCFGPDASKTKRVEHVFAEADDLHALISAAGFTQVEVTTVSKLIRFPSVLDYVRFQLIATPMAGLLRERNEAERKAIIENVAETTRSLIGQEMLHDGRFSFPQEAHVAIAHRGD
jgi:ubiquinone/menaquinone biosynthesis C-methylase UbiE